MDDNEILHRITALVDEEHQLTTQGEQGGLDEEKRARIKSIEVSLDQCWDLLRQRRARREFGLNPDEAKERGPETVEHFQQ